MTPRKATPQGAKGVGNPIYFKALALLAALSLLSACDDLRFPRDVEETLKTVLSEQKMTVAVSENPPWVVLANSGPPQGVEADLTRAFAEELGSPLSGNISVHSRRWRGWKRGTSTLPSGALPARTGPR